MIYRENCIENVLLTLLRSWREEAEIGVDTMSLWKYFICICVATRGTFAYV